jgi:hypothetical protein
MVEVFAAVTLLVAEAGSAALAVAPAAVEAMPPDMELPRCRMDWATFWRE